MNLYRNRERLLMFSLFYIGWWGLWIFGLYCYSTNDAGYHPYIKKGIEYFTPSVIFTLIYTVIVLFLLWLKDIERLEDFLITFLLLDSPLIIILFYFL